MKKLSSVGNSEAAKEGDPCPLALDPWPQYLFFIFIVLLIIISKSFVVIIERRGPKESIEQYNSTEEHNQQKTQKSKAKSRINKEAESTEDNRNRTQVKHSIYDVVNRRTRNNVV